MKTHHKNTNSKHLDGEQLLKRAMASKFKLKKDNKLRGAFGETDFDNKTIRINKKKHADTAIKGGPRNPNGTASLLDTEVHELHHLKDPKATEKQVRKRAQKTVKRLSPRQKKKVFALFK